MKLSDAVAVLSQATDLSMGQTQDYALASCRLSMRLGEALGLDEADMRQAYFHSLLRHIGCNAEGSFLASIAGDEIHLRKEYSRVDSFGGAARAMIRTIRGAHPSASEWHLARMGARGILAFPKIRSNVRAHCEVAQRLGARMGFEVGLINALGQLYERWDGKGTPNGLKGESIALSTRLVSLAQGAVIFHRLGGVEAALSTILKRKGKTYDPHMAEVFCKKGATLLAGLEGDQDWDVILKTEPGTSASLSLVESGRILEVFADFSDMKSQFTLGHSTAVSALVRQSAQQFGFDAKEAEELSRAALAHNLGRVGISSSIWEKPGPLSNSDWDKVRLHPYYTERLLARSQVLLPLGRLASYHQERLDGSGYHRGISDKALSIPSRLLGTAVSYQAMLEPRPHREALSPDEAGEELQKEAKLGRLDPDAVRAVLAASGQGMRARGTRAVAGLSERELEVLRLLSRGDTMKIMGEKLFISVKTVDRHIQNIYGKIGVTTRAAAALFASENRLLS